MFSPVTSGRISAEIVEQIRTLIREGQLVPGDQLPSERELTQRLGVSRVSVRDALRVLEAHGLIEVRVGARGGAFVTAPAPELIGEGIVNMLMLASLTQAEVAEARIVLERGVLALACERIDDDDLAALEAICDQAEALVASGQADPSLSGEFHATVGRATHNEAITMLVASLHAPALASHEADPVELRKVVAAIRARDADAAGALMETILRV